MTSITKDLIIQIQATISNLNIRDQKEDLVYAATKGRTTSVSEMYMHEAIDLKNHLKKFVNAKPSEKEDKMRRKVISLCHQMNMKLADGKIDMAQVDKLIAARGYLSKLGKTSLNQYTSKELPKLITQIERIRDFYLTKTHG